MATAFLQGKQSDRKIWVQLPAEALRLLNLESGTRMRLKKSMYGLPDGPRLWFQEASDRLLACGLLPHPLEPCMFISYGPGRVDGCLCHRVDDMRGTGNANDKRANSFGNRLLQLRSAFNFRTWESGKPMDFCGAQLQLEPNSDYNIYNHDYMRKLKPITIDKSRKFDDPVAVHERKSLKGLFDNLAWLANQTSPHLQCSVSLLQGRSGEAATVEVLQESQFRQGE